MPTKTLLKRPKMWDKIILFFINLYYGSRQGTYHDENGVYDIDTNLIYEYYADAPVEEKKVKPDWVKVPIKMPETKEFNVTYTDGGLVGQPGNVGVPGINGVFIKDTTRSVVVQPVILEEKKISHFQVLDIYGDGEQRTYQVVVHIPTFSYTIKSYDIFTFEESPELRFNVLEHTRHGFNCILSIKLLNMHDQHIKIKRGSRIYKVN